MAYTTINKSTEHFNTKLYAGNSSTQALTGVGFQPDWVWIKNRSDTRKHNLYDAIRGVTKRIVSNANSAEDTASNGLTAFGTDGFTTGSEQDTNHNGNNFVSWNWKGANGTTSNSNGTTTSTVSANTTAGFSIVQYAGASSAKTIGHGLGVVPEMIIVKTYSSGYEWAVYHKETGHGKNLYLDSSGGASNTTTFWNNTAPTNQVFSTGGQIIYTNYSGQNYIAYCFASKKGYSKIGKYTCNQNADGPFVYTGFKPAFLLIKRLGSDPWMMLDNRRDGHNVTEKYLAANATDSEATEGSSVGVDLLSNGFKLRGTSGKLNSTNNGVEYIYMAIGQSLVGSNNVPCTAF
jgi:hypothetical protein